MTNCAGRQLLKAFDTLGKYHVIFWNCKVFAKVFLELICQKKVDFGGLSASDITCLVVDIVRFAKLIIKTLCAFIIPSPIATSKWRKEHQKSKALISETIKRANESIGDDLIAVSDDAINFIVLETFSEPENSAQIGKLQQPKESKVAFTSYF